MHATITETTIPDRTVNGVSMLAVIEKNRQDVARNLERTEERIARIFAAGALLEAAGFRTGISTYSTYGLFLTVTREQLPLLRQTLGSMRVSSKSVKDSRKRLLDVTLRFRDHPDVEVTYEKKMPRRKKDEPAPVRCRIVRKVRVEHVLVCDSN